MSISKAAPCAWTLYLVERYMPTERAEALTVGTRVWPGTLGCPLNCCHSDLALMTPVFLLPLLLSPDEGSKVERGDAEHCEMGCSCCHVWREGRVPENGRVATPGECCSVIGWILTN